ncbi:unnamed protein product [Clonostachys rosea]|uniref:Uncharacterized protein n=1 Tax=Bionectria ochroleuca TaxID=29856 RepID=A0ABY6UC52_BIOOC|nr:unnamed protein product [Clonostachys rosea]
MSFSQAPPSTPNSPKFHNPIPMQGSPVQKLISQWETRCDNKEQEDEKSTHFKLESDRHHFDRRMSESSWMGSQSSDTDSEEYEAWPSVSYRPSTHLDTKVKTRLWRETVEEMTLEEACERVATLSLVRESLTTDDSEHVEGPPKRELDIQQVPEEPEVLYPEWLQYGCAVVWEYLTLSPQ